MQAYLLADPGFLCPSPYISMNRGSFTPWSPLTDTTDKDERANDRWKRSVSLSVRPSIRVLKAEDTRSQKPGPIFDSDFRSRKLSPVFDSENRHGRNK